MEFPRVSPGQPISQNPFIRNTRVINHALEATAAYVATALGGGGDEPFGGPLGGNRVMLKNASGGDRARGEVLKISYTKLLEETDIHAPWFEGVEPDTTLGRVAVLQNPLKEDEIGPAFIAGVCPALLGTLAGNYAYAKAGQFQLKPGRFGHFEVLKNGENEGLLWVRFVECPMVYGKLGGDLGQNGFATMHLYDPELNLETGDDITVYDRLLNGFKELVADTRVFATPMGDRWYAQAASACPTNA